MQLKQGNLLERMPPGERSAFGRLAHRQLFERHAALFHQGEPGSAFFVLESGSVRTFFTAGDGSEFTIGFWKAGDLCGTADLAAQRRALSAVAETPVRAFELGLADLGPLIQHCPVFSQELIKALSFKIRWTSMIAANLATKSARERLTEILRALAEIDGVPIGAGRWALTRRFSQEELALMAGCSRQWVSHELSVLRDRGALGALPDGRWVVAPGRLRSGPVPASRPVPAAGRTPGAGAGPGAGPGRPAPSRRPDPPRLSGPRARPGPRVPAHVDDEEMPS